MKHDSFSFPKSARLLKQHQFRDVLRNGKHYYGKFVVVHCLSRPKASPVKIGITVSRKFGKAHLRNRFKRVVREAFRRLQPEFVNSFYLNVRPGQEALEASMGDIESELRILLLPVATLEMEHS